MEHFYFELEKNPLAHIDCVCALLALCTIKDIHDLLMVHTFVSMYFMIISIILTVTGSLTFVARMFIYVVIDKHQFYCYIRCYVWAQ